MHSEIEELREVETKLEELDRNKMRRIRDKNIEKKV